MTLKKRRTILIISIVTFLFGALFVSFYSQGYILDGKWKISKRGGLYVYVPLTNAKIFVNNEEKKASGFLKSTIFLPRLRPNEYTVLTAKEGYWPWAKTLSVKEGYVTEARSMMMPLDPRGEILLRGKLIQILSSPYQKIIVLKEEIKNDNFKLSFYLPNETSFLTEKSLQTKNLLMLKGEISDIAWGENYLIFKNNKGFVKAVFDLSEKTVIASYIKKPTESKLDYEHERLTNAKDQKVWWDAKTNEIFVDWLNKDDKKPPYYLCAEEPCNLPVLLFNSRYHIKNVDFFPGRKDIVIIAVSNGIYALEIDGRGERMLQPIYKGKNPNFAIIHGENTICVLDEGSLIKIYLDK